jgi:ketosteroid isomerase-like protein
MPVLAFCVQLANPTKLTSRRKTTNEPHFDRCTIVGIICFHPFQNPQIMPRKLFPTPADCEAAFYDALERADLKLMMTVWADEPAIVCIHPQGPRLAGMMAIRESFAELFSHGPNGTVHVSELRNQVGQTLAVHNVYETFQVKNDPAPNSVPPVLATNIYLLTPNGWRMTLHHASVSPRGTVAEEQGVARILH